MIRIFLISLLILSLSINSAVAGLIVGNDIPTSLEINALPESDTDIFLYLEQEDFTLTSELAVDYLATTGLSGNILLGTKVNSFVFNYDAVGIDYNRGSFNSAISHLFDTKILAIIWSGYRSDIVNQPLSDNNLDASDGILGLGNVSYATGTNGRGLEVESLYDANGTRDSFTVSGKQIDLSLFVRAPYADQLRVITAAKIPEPTAILLFGTALCLFGFRRFS
tara:strand:+ start:424 stop:1092 length:669 start_codon:yes stop_codon:yes gene_type:complete